MRNAPAPQCFLGFNRQTEDDFAGAVETLEQMVANPAAKLARHPRARGQFDSAITGVAVGAADGGLSHGEKAIMSGAVFLRRRCWRTGADRRRRQARTKLLPTSAAKTSSELSSGRSSEGRDLDQDVAGGGAIECVPTGWI